MYGFWGGGILVLLYLDVKCELTVLCGGRTGVKFKAGPNALRQEVLEVLFRVSRSVHEGAEAEPAAAEQPGARGTGAELCGPDRRGGLLAPGRRPVRADHGMGQRYTRMISFHCLVQQMGHLHH